MPTTPHFLPNVKDQQEGVQILIKLEDWSFYSIPQTCMKIVERLQKKEDAATGTVF
jgi:hypothetical protein